MADLPADGNITADGDYDIVLQRGSAYDFNLTGDFGSGGIVTVKQENPLEAGAFSNVFTRSAMISNYTNIFRCRARTTIRITLAGATSPDLYVFFGEVKSHGSV